MSRISISLLAFALCAGSAGAAAAQSWSGPYIGLTMGGGMVDDDSSETVLFDTNLDGSFNDTVKTSTGANAFASSSTTPAGFCGGKANAGDFASGCIPDDQVELEFALRGGVDFDMGGFVVGGLLEVSTFGVEDNVAAFSTTPANYAFSRSIEDAVLSARGRIGLPIDRLLVYGTAGFAVTQVEERFTSTNTLNAYQPTANDTMAKGYQAGAGIEYRLNDRVRIGGEYLYTDLSVDEALETRISRGTAPATSPFVLTNASGTDARRSSDDFKYHAFRLTISTAF